MKKLTTKCTKTAVYVFYNGEQIAYLSFDYDFLEKIGK
jgi:hypothetical protein